MALMRVERKLLQQQHGKSAREGSHSEPGISLHYGGTGFLVGSKEAIRSFPSAFRLETQVLAVLVYETSLFGRER